MVIQLFGLLFKTIFWKFSRTFFRSGWRKPIVKTMSSCWIMTGGSGTFPNSGYDRSVTGSISSVSSPSMYSVVAVRRTANHSRKKSARTAPSSLGFSWLAEEFTDKFQSYSRHMSCISEQSWTFLGPRHLYHSASTPLLWKRDCWCIHACLWLLQTCSQSRME